MHIHAAPVLIISYAVAPLLILMLSSFAMLTAALPYNYISLSAPMDATTIAQLFTLIGGGHSLWSYLSPKKAADRFGYGTDALSVIMVEILLSTALGNCTIAAGLFFLQMNTEQAIALGYIPTFVQCSKIVLCSDHYVSTLGGKMGNKFKLVLLLHVLVLYGAFQGASWTKYIMIFTSCWGLTQALLATFCTKNLAMRQHGAKIANSSKFLAMKRNNAGVTSYFCVFVLCLLNGMAATRAYTCGMCMTLASLLLTRFLYGDVKREGFDKKGANFWAFFFIAAIVQMLRD